MKKLLSITMALCIAFTTMLTGMTAMAAIPKSSDLKAQLQASADYLASNDKTAYTVNNAAEFLDLINSGKDMSAYKEAFVKSVKNNLDINDAKLILEKTDLAQSEDEGKTIAAKIESPAVYASVMLALEGLGYDPQAFYGYNIKSSFSAIDLSTNQDNPYYYNIALKAAEKYGLSKTFKKQLCDGLINQYYTLGKGMNYYGYSCDNTCRFVAALAPYYQDYKTMVDDAITLIETCKTSGGYFSEAQYGTAANADSTALALAAYSAMGNIDKAQSIYSDLCKFETTKKGVFGYTDNKEENAYATRDALFGLECFSETLSVYTPPVVKGLALKSKSTTALRLVWNKSSYATGYIVYQYNETSKKYNKIAEVGSSTVNYKVSGLKAGTVYKFRVSAVFNSNEGAKSSTLSAATVPAKGSIKSVKSTKKKKITVALNKKTCSGYQIQWSTKKDFSSNYKTTTISKATTTTKTISVAQSGKKYYVRVRAWTKVSGTKVYGNWSAAKSVKTK